MEEIAYLIPLTQGRHALVDKEDWEELRKHKWQAFWAVGGSTFYAARSIRLPDGRRTTGSMARQILGLPHGDPRVADHLNHNTLDNRRHNLRITTPRGNSENLRHQSPLGIGVQMQPSGRFQAVAWFKGKRRCLGTYDTPEEAAEARRHFLEQHDGPQQTT